MLVDAGYSTEAEEKGNSFKNPLSSYLMGNNKVSKEQSDAFRNNVKQLIAENPDNTVTKYLESQGIQTVNTQEGSADKRQIWAGCHDCNTSTLRPYRWVHSCYESLFWRKYKNVLGCSI